jgi:D-alanine-D-alanine ligase-like ATP-grasp enzyme
MRRSDSDLRPRRSFAPEALSALAARGKAGAALGREVDALLSLGPRLYWQQARDPTAAELAGAGRKSVYRRIWEDAAARIGAQVREGPPGYLEIRREGRSIRLWGPLVPLDDPVTLQLAGDKPAAHSVLSAAGLPVPRYRTVPVADTDAAVAFTQEQGPCVVKPASSTGAGRGVTGGVSNRADLLRARLRAARFDPDRLLLERQADGEEYRVLVLDGEAIGVVHRLPPRVVGDGRSTVAELAARENRRRRDAGGAAGLWPIRLDLDALIALRSQGLTVRSVPAAAQVVAVKSSTSEGSELDATVVDARSAGVRGVVANACTAAAAIGARFASVEMITGDPAVPLAEAGGVVIEVNTTPGVAQHYLVSNRTDVVPVAEAVLSRLLAP